MVYMSGKSFKKIASRSTSAKSGLCFHEQVEIRNEITGTGADPEFWQVDPKCRLQ